MSYAALETAIDAAWEDRAALTPATTGEVRDAVEATLEALDGGTLRVAERGADGQWTVNQWAKKAVLLSFRLNDMVPMEGGPQGSAWWDKVDTKFKGWDEARWRQAGFRAVPGAIVRRSAFIGRGAILMPSFVNLGAHVGEGTMVDTWATVGSCAQIGADVHLSGGVGIGGVLEPLQASPVIVEDGAFLGSRCILTEGVRVGAGAVLAPNVSLTGSVPIIDVTGDHPVEHRGYVPPRSVVLPGTRPKDYPAGRFEVACALIVGQRSESTDLRTSLNAVLREFELGS